MKSTGEITQEPRGKYSVFTIENYARYQGAGAGGRWLCLPALPSAGRVWLAYQAKAPRLTEDTPEGWLLPLEEDACALLPLYIAGQLYKEDDLQLATYYMNEFETGLYALAPADKGVLADAFTSESGW